MKFYISVLCLFVMFLSSCSTTYFYSTMSSNDPYIQKSDLGEFVYEGDSLNVYYKFYGENSQISVGIKNKSSRPLFIDWRKSGVVIDSVFSSFLPPYEESVSDDLIAEQNRLITDEDGIAGILPGERIDRTMLELSNLNFHKIKSKKYKQTHVGENKEKYPAVKYDENNSPIRLYTYLTTYTKAEDMSQPLVFENDFFLSDIFKTSASPLQIAEYKDGRGDMFYTKKETGYKFWGGVGKGLKVVGITALTVGVVALEVALDSLGEE